MGDWKNARLRNLSETDKRRDNSRVQSGFGKKIENWVGRELAYPDNVLHLATECNNRGHSATFPLLAQEPLLLPQNNLTGAVSALNSIQRMCRSLKVACKL
jgi:hypothetical protein